MQVKNNFLLKTFFVWIYITSLIYSVYSLSLQWDYQGIFFYNQSIDIYIFIYLLSIIPILFLPKKLFLPSDYVSVYIYIFTYIPAVCVPFFLIEDSKFKWDYIYYVLFLLVALLIIVKTSYYKNSIVLLIKPISEKLISIVFISIYLITTLVFVLTFGLKFQVPSFGEIYDVRMQYREITSGNIVTRYFIFWMGYVVNIFLFVIAVLYKKKYLIYFTILYQFYIFSLIALKSHIATMILSYILVLFFKKYKSLSSFNFIIFSTTFIVVVVLLDLVIGFDLFQNLITRRILVVPSQLSYYHYEFFTENQKTYWAYTIFKNIFEYPYFAPPPNVIGDVYFGLPHMTAVVNLFMDGYTAFGYIGIIIVALLLKYILKLVNTIFIRRSQSSLILIITFLGICNILNSSSIFTILMTQGLLLQIILYLLFPWSILNKKSE